MYEFEVGKSVVKAAENINLAFGEVYVNVVTAHGWFVKFKVCNFSLENGPRGKRTVPKFYELKYEILEYLIKLYIFAFSEFYLFHQS